MPEYSIPVLDSQGRVTFQTYEPVESFEDLWARMEHEEKELANRSRSEMIRDLEVLFYVIVPFILLGALIPITYWLFTGVRIW